MTQQEAWQWLADTVETRLREIGGGYCRLLVNGVSCVGLCHAVVEMHRAGLVTRMVRDEMLLAIKAEGVRQGVPPDSYIWGGDLAGWAARRAWCLGQAGLALVTAAQGDLVRG